MKIEEIRHNNLKLLIAERGSLTAVADAADTAMNYLSQIINGTHAQSGKARSVGTKLARKLEAGCGKPDGWMDKPQFVNKTPATFPNETWEQLNPQERDMVFTVVNFFSTNKPQKNVGEEALLKAFRNCSSEARTVVISVAESQATSSKREKPKK